jgi:hypothetical protein
MLLSADLAPLCLLMTPYARLAWPAGGAGSSYPAAFLSSTKVISSLTPGVSTATPSTMVGAYRSLRGVTETVEPGCVIGIEVCSGAHY